jgi:5-methylcytosine-specific restriction endonuclease McrA
MPRLPRVNECGHPEAKHEGHGMCNACFQRARSRSRGVKPVAKRLNECGHPDRKHLARGMCSSCYAQSVPPEKRRADFQRLKADPERYAVMLARGRVYHAANRDVLLAKQKAWKAEPERKAHFAAYQRAYRAKQGKRPRWTSDEYDPLSGARNANNRARRLGIPGRVTTDEVRQVMRGACVQCGSTSQPSLDHIQPLSRGGSNTKDNLQRLCFPCNSRKRDRPIGVAA